MFKEYEGFADVRRSPIDTLFLTGITRRRLGNNGTHNALLTYHGRQFLRIRFRSLIRLYLHQWNPPTLHRMTQRSHRFTLITVRIHDIRHVDAITVLQAYRSRCEVTATEGRVNRYEPSVRLSIRQHTVVELHVTGCKQRTFTLDWLLLIHGIPRSHVVVPLITGTDALEGLRIESDAILPIEITLVILIERRKHDFLPLDVRQLRLVLQHLHTTANRIDQRPPCTDPELLTALFSTG